MKTAAFGSRLCFLLFLQLWVAGESASRIVSKAYPQVLSHVDQCEAVGKCEMCTSSDLRAVPICKDTGRMQKLHCTADDTSGAMATTPSYRSCRRTEVDEEFAMVRFQMFCILLGSMAFASVRRQKRLSASLFDQRKRGNRLKGRLQEDNEEELIEMGKIEEESLPLIRSTNRLEVI